MISLHYIRFVPYFAVAVSFLSCSNKSPDIDERGIAREDPSAPKQRLELKSTLGYQQYSKYIVTANVYKDNILHKDCIVVKNDYCSKFLGYRYCSVWPGYTEINPQLLANMILPIPMKTTAEKFNYSEICNDEIFNTSLLVNHFILMLLFNKEIFQSIVLTDNTFISNADVIAHGERKSTYYNSVSCYGKAKSAFIKDSDYIQAGLAKYRYYIQQQDANLENGEFVIYEIEPKITTYYTLSGYDCRPIKGHKLTPTTATYKGYSYADIENLMAHRLTYCKSMCKSYDEEGKSNGWATEPDSSITPVSLDDVTSEPPKFFVNTNAKTDAHTAPAAPTADTQITARVSIPDLIPAPTVTTPPETRLVFKRSVKNRKGKREYLIFDDTQLGTPCYVSLLDNQDVLTNTHYCIPYSGSDAQLKHPLEPTKTATTLEYYKFCDNNISVEKRNIPGLAGFFKAFNPDYYQTQLQQFINNPFTVRKSKFKSKNPYDYEIFYISGYEDECACGGPDNSACALDNPFITETEYKNYNLKPGVVFLTPSAAKGERVLHQYWQVLSGVPEVVCVESLAEDGYTDDFFEEKVIQVRDLSSQDTYVELMPQLNIAMSARSSYCQAVNNTLINEARAGNWALIEADSPLLNKK